MLFDGPSLRRRVGHQVFIQVDHGLRTRPFLTLVLIAAAAVLVAAIFLVFLVTALAFAILAAAGLLAYAACKQLLRSRQAIPRIASVPTFEERADILRHYLAAVEEFSRLTQIALTQPVDIPARGKAVRQAAAGAARLRVTARGLVRAWRGGSELDICLHELEAGAESLAVFLDEILETGERRSSAGALRWRRDDLSRRRDSLAAHLREADFRAAAQKPAAASGRRA